MSDNTRIFPAIQINQLADPVQFVEIWSKYFPFDEPDYEKYLDLIENDSFTEEEFLWLFEYLLGEKLTGDRYNKYMEEIGSRVGIWNVLKENEDIGNLYTDPFMYVEPKWFVLLLHLLYHFPFFDDNICLAYRFITTGELSDIESDDDFLSTHGSFTVFSWEIVEQTPGYDEFAWRNALWAFGKFLKEFGWVMY